MDPKYAEILLMLQRTKDLPLAITAALKSIEDGLASRIPTAIKGDRGFTGSQGPLGMPGMTGPQGIQGLLGPMGPIGPAGSDGRDGAMGPAGLPGKDGKNGKDGSTGSQGPIGPAGKDGAQGKDGLDGRDGSPDTGADVIYKINHAPDSLENKIHASKIVGLSTMVLGMGPGGSGGNSTGGGTPANPLNSVQFNKAGAFGGNSQFFFDQTHTALILGDTVNPLGSIRIWANGTGDLIDFGTFPTRFGVLGNDVVGSEIGLLDWRDAYIAVVNVSNHFQYGGNASGNTVGIISRYDQKSAGVGILLPTHPWEIYNNDTSRGSLYVQGFGNGGGATVGQIMWADYSTGNILGVLSDLNGGGLQGSFYLIGDSVAAASLSGEMCDFFVLDRQLQPGDARVGGLIGRTDNAGGYRMDILVRNGGGGFSYRWGFTPTGLLVGIGGDVDGFEPSAALHLTASDGGVGNAPLKFTSGTLLGTTAAGAIEFNTDLLYQTTTTSTKRKTLLGAIASRLTAKTAAQASVVTFTPPADSSFIISANVLVTTATAHNFSVQCTYTDEGNTARTFTFNMSTIGGVLGTAITNAGGAVPYEGIPVHIRVKANTAITIATVGTFTTVTYNVEGALTQIA